MSNENFEKEPGRTPDEGREKSVEDIADSPLPGVKADDQEETRDEDLSDEEVARRLAQRDDVDSGDGVHPEDRGDDRGEGGDTIQPPPRPFLHGR